ncbi:SDR family oxidoreductase [Shewanella alkalitolerans]|uniref:SDR family NAD(P)-dependent oxidoreductase n=1 Tax=Shewanella alkalitolerans TaxID=2864209 RepID=UPI001C6596F7|nr:SDR family oxidoreductase [Shewanella alkalitolerans]QYJ98955.1 SDR family oxidoreductase [Shewanella alkalitolerans]
MKKTVLITGATSDIGLSIAQKHVYEGNFVVLLGRDEEKLQSVVGLLGEDSCAHYVWDLNALYSLKPLLKDIVSKHGKLTDLICAAGYHKVQPLKLISNEELMLMMQTNVHSHLMLCQLFSNSLYSNKMQNRSVTMISSIAHFVGEPGLVAYSAAKGALISASKSLARELAPRNIRVNTISPGWVETKHTKDVANTLGNAALEKLHSLYPLGLGTPKDVADACYFLSSDASRWITGLDLVIDGGRSV